VLQRSIDSLAERLNMVPVRPAIAAQVAAAFQAQVDSINAVRVEQQGSFDGALAQQQIAGHSLMAAYIQQFMSVVQRPELNAMLESALSVAKTEVLRARALLSQVPTDTMR
jgi:hypothetical protein